MSAFFLLPGSYLLSRKVALRVPSAWEGLTAVFGMGTGGSLPLSPPDYFLECGLPHPENCIEKSVFVFHSSDSLLCHLLYFFCVGLTTSLAFRKAVWSSPRPISISPLKTCLLYTS